jgi:hypothetical protein
MALRSAMRLTFALPVLSQLMARFFERMNSFSVFGRTPISWAALEIETTSVSSLGILIPFGTEGRAECHLLDFFGRPGLRLRTAARADRSMNHWTPIFFALSRLERMNCMMRECETFSSLAAWAVVSGNGILKLYVRKEICSRLIDKPY